MKPKLKPLGTDRLTLKQDEPLSIFAFNFNLRRYRVASTATRSTIGWCRLGLADIARLVSHPTRFELSLF
jgi:hypothetical protein